MRAEAPCGYMQLSQRFWNAHAMINMSVWLRTEQPSLATALSRKLGIKVAADPCLTQVRVVIGSPRQELEGMPKLCKCIRYFSGLRKVRLAPWMLRNLEPFFGVCLICLTPWLEQDLE